MSLGIPCFECGEPADYRHHIIPRKMGGKSTVPLCALCHAKVHGRSFTMHHGTLTKQGLERARAEGRFGGRRRKMTATKIRQAMALMADRSTQVGAIATRDSSKGAVCFS